MTVVELLLLVVTFKNHQPIVPRLRYLLRRYGRLGGPFLLCVAIAARLEKINAINQLRLCRSLIFERTRHHPENKHTKTNSASCSP